MSSQDAMVVQVDERDLRPGLIIHSSLLKEVQLEIYSGCRFVCSEHPEFEARHIAHVLDHVLLHLPETDHAIVSMCYEKEQVEREDCDIRVAFLEYGVSNRSKGKPIKTDMTLYAPCTAHKPCGPDPEKIHLFTCKYSSRWHIRTPYYRFGASRWRT